MPINSETASVTVICEECNHPISDQYKLEIGDRSWHVGCLRCSSCKCLLEDRCFQRGHQLLCEADFYKKYGVRCFGCDQVLLPDEMVRRVRDKCFHVHCFRCAYCQKQLATGDELYIVDDCKFVCQTDYNSFCADKIKSTANYPVTIESIEGEMGEESATVDRAAEQLESGSAADTSGDNGSCSLSQKDALGGSKMGRRRRRSSELVLDCSDCSDSDRLDSASIDSEDSASDAAPDHDHDTAAHADKDSSGSRGGHRNSSSNSTNSHHGNHNNNNNNNSSSAGTSGAKRRGPRTTIKAKQLDTLKNAFSTTPKPSRHIREQLAAETGLNMRVIQVWFQNRRSKERRMKQLNAMGLNRRMLFNRGPRRLRALRAGLDQLDPMMAMLAESGSSGAPNIDMSLHHHPSLSANQSVGVRPCDYFAAAAAAAAAAGGDHSILPPQHSDYMISMQHAVSHPAQKFTDYYPSTTCIV